MTNVYKFLGIFIVLVAVSACNQTVEQKENKALERKMLGKWASVSLKLTMNSFSNKDTVKIFEVKEGEWEQKMRIKPIITIYFGDGTYVAEHRNLRDSAIFNPAGRWTIMGDTLIVRDTFPEPGLPYRYKVAFNNDRLEFTGIEDCDGDGSADDNYFGMQLRLK